MGNKYNELIGYNELSFINKLRFRWRLMQEERVEDQRQAIEHDDRLPIDTQKIVDKLLAEQENKKNKVKSFPVIQETTYEKTNTLNRYKYPVEGALEAILAQDEIRLEQMLSRKFNSLEDAYENIVELKTFLSYTHDYIPDVEKRINEKLSYIQNTLGKDILDKGLRIYTNHKYLIDTYNTISVQESIKLENKILQNPQLAKKLSDLRYNLEEFERQPGKFYHYAAVYSHMVETSRYNDYRQQAGLDEERAE